MRILIGLICVVFSSLSFLPAQTGPLSPRLIQLMKEYTEAPAPSGYEGPVRRLLERDFRALGVQFSTDGLGSVIGVVHGASDHPRIMVDAHMDEVGLMVQYITRDGYISFQPLGGWVNQALLGQRWVIVTDKGPVTAISGMPDAHIWPAEERNRVIPREEILLDVGARSKADAEALGIRPGDPIAPESPFTALADGRYAAKAWDDRVGLLAMLEAARRLKERGIKTPNTLYLVGSTQEEIGLRGAQTAVEMVKPDLGIALEVGIAQYPGVRPETVQEKLGLGPALFLYDKSVIPNLKLRDFFLRVAAEKNIPLQTEVVNGGYGEDAKMIQMFSTGRPAVNLTVPTRYTHSHTGIIDGNDFEHTVELLMEVLTRLDAKTVEEISSFQ